MYQIYTANTNFGYFYDRIYSKNSIFKEIIIFSKNIRRLCIFLPMLIKIYTCRLSSCIVVKFLRYMPFILYGGDLWPSGTTDEAIIDDRCQDMNGNQEQTLLSIWFFETASGISKKLDRKQVHTLRCSLSSLQWRSSVIKSGGAKSFKVKSKKKKHRWLIK